MQRTSPHKPITSKDNGIMKHLRSLSDPKVRKKENAFLIEGVKMVEEALRDDLGVVMLIAAPDLVQHHGKGILKLAENKSVEVLWISARLMDAVSESKTPQPVMAVLKMRSHTVNELIAHDAELIVVAQQLQDPGNLGAIIRTVEAVGASGVAVSKNTVDPHNAKTVRASMGSILRVPVVNINDTTAFLHECRQRHFQTVAATLTAEKTHFDIDFAKPTVVILGQEGAGLPQDLLAGVDLRVRIPMAETIDSLNVAAAAAVVLYEAMRQRSYPRSSNKQGLP